MSKLIHPWTINHIISFCRHEQTVFHRWQLLSYEFSWTIWVESYSANLWRTPYNYSIQNSFVCFNSAKNTFKSQMSQTCSCQVSINLLLQDNPIHTVSQPNWYKMVSSKLEDFSAVCLYLLCTIQLSETASKSHELLIKKTFRKIVHSYCGCSKRRVIFLFQVVIIVF